MNPVAAICIVGAAGTAVLAIIWLRIARAPGYRAMRLYAAIAATATGYCLADLTQVVCAPPSVVRWGAQISLAFGALHAVAWISWFAASQDRSLTRAERAARCLGCALAVVALIPGVFVSHRIASFAVGLLGVTYQLPVLTALGASIYVYFILTMGLVGWTSLRRWREERRARLTITIVAVLMAVGIHDTLVTVRVLTMPLLADAAFFVVIVGWGLIELERFVKDAQRLETLSSDLEHQVRERSQELANTHAELARAEKLAAMGQLSAGIAHEVNNPAAAIASNLGYLTDRLARGEKIADEELRASLSDSLEATWRISRTVRQLLDAGGGASSSEPTLRPCDLCAVVERAVVQTNLTVDHGVAIDYEVAPELGVLADSGLLEQALVNVLKNAIHAVEPRRDGARIRVSAAREGDLVVVGVRDNGTGIASDLQGRLFEPFFTTKELGQGTGLGLAVSLGLMRSQGGDLRLVETSSEGTTFALTVPFCDPSPVSGVKSAPPSGHTGLRLLIVDDERAVRDSLRRWLSSHFHVETAQDVASALARIARTPRDIDVVLSDLVMPDGGGARLYAEIKRTAPHLVARVLFLTGAALTGDSKRLLADEAVKVLYKPADPVTLRSTLLSLVSSGRAA